MSEKLDPVVFLWQWFHRQPPTEDREVCLQAVRDIAIGIGQMQQNTEYAEIVQRAV